MRYSTGIPFALMLTLTLGCAAPPPAVLSPSERAAVVRDDLTDFRGKVVLLTFGATWCPMCAIELRELEMAQHKLAGHPIQIVAVLIDDDRARVRAFVRENGLSFPVLADDGGKLQSKYKVLSLPATIALDAEGAQIELVDPESGESVMQIDGPRSWDKPHELETLRQLAKKLK